MKIDLLRYDLPFELPRDMVKEAVLDEFDIHLIDPIVSGLYNTQIETVENLWTTFRVAFGRSFIFGAAALFTLADQLNELVIDYYQ